MALILCIETATKTCSVALSLDGKCIALEEKHDILSHGSLVTVFIEKTLHSSNYNKSDLDAIAISNGPGSYTGLRIGMSTAKGLCYALDIPLLEIDTLHSLAYGMKNQIDKTNFIMIPSLDARRDEVYYAVYNNNLKSIQKSMPLVLIEDSFKAFENQKIYLAGSGSQKIIEICESNFKSLQSCDISAKNMAFICDSLYKKHIFANVVYTEPNYLKPFQGTKPKK